jgi:hypothetical protein
MCTLHPAKTAIVCLGLLAIAPAAAHAADVSQVRLDLSTPDLPAFTALGVSPSQISTPTNVKDFVAAVSSGLSPTGQVQSGVAIEVAPVQLLWKKDATAVDESVKRLARWVDGLAISIGTNALAGAAMPTMQTAIGVRWAIQGYTPQADPALAKCIAGAIPKVTIPTELDAEGSPKVAELSPDTPEMKKTRQLCRDAFRAAHLASRGLQIAYVHSAQAVGDAKLSSFSTLADTIWLSGSWDFNNAKPPTDFAADKLKVPAAPLGFQPTLFARYDAFNLGSGLGRQSDLFVAARLPVITPGWSAFVEGGFKTVNLSDRAAPAVASGSKVPFGLGGDLRLGDGTWFGVYAGVDLKTGEIFSLGNVKWSIGEKRSYEY